VNDFETNKKGELSTGNSNISSTTLFLLPVSSSASADEAKAKMDEALAGMEKESLAKVVCSRYA